MGPQCCQGLIPFYHPKFMNSFVFIVNIILKAFWWRRHICFVCDNSVGFKEWANAPMRFFARGLACGISYSLFSFSYTRHCVIWYGTYSCKEIKKQLLFPNWSTEKRFFVWMILIIICLYFLLFGYVVRWEKQNQKTHIPLFRGGGGEIDEGKQKQ